MRWLWMYFTRYLRESITRYLLVSQIVVIKWSWSLFYKMSERHLAKTSYIKLGEMPSRQSCKTSSRFANPKLLNIWKTSCKDAFKTSFNVDCLDKMYKKDVFAKCLILHYMRCRWDSFPRCPLDLKIRQFLGV